MTIFTLLSKFKDWFGERFDGRPPPCGGPSGKEVFKYFECKYGTYPNNGWSQFSFKKNSTYLE